MRYSKDGAYQLDFPVARLLNGQSVDLTGVAMFAGFSRVDSEPTTFVSASVIIETVSGKPEQFVRTTIGPGQASTLLPGRYMSYVKAGASGPIFEAGAIEVY